MFTVLYCMWCVSCYLYVYCVVLYVVRELLFICLLCCIVCGA
jgi:hypothetical protein